MRKTKSFERIERIKKSIGIKLLVGDMLAGKERSKNLSYLCPNCMKGELKVSEKKDIFHCFSCGTGGSIFNFVMMVKKMTFPDAVKYIEKTYIYG